ncbi:hypothetical protein HELRODRAFT_180246 [Helobdella robusta]|uniref:Apple domain-containing protein n=1 Tax=Helobdella robusta TaxID=6412 RepID=T1FFM4_HELRO|nr:hypothetical protein HELRODRAFT_180246 [Helobdella robusta]ESN94078.1 hypothetical protein HELRODRAFT_180246 [Helobdella robusta]
MNSSSFSSLKSVEALVLCSMRCSQTASCVAYNFFTGSNQCQLFNQTLKKFSLVLIEFYINGNNISVPLYFPNAIYWDKPDTYKLPDQLYVVAVFSRNTDGIGGMKAETADDYIFTNSTWKCTNNFYNGWYDVGYNDSSWPAAVIGRLQSANTFSLIPNGVANWIFGPIDCQDCLIDFYCRKNFLAFQIFQDLAKIFGFEISIYGKRNDERSSL